MGIPPLACRRSMIVLYEESPACHQSPANLLLSMFSSLFNRLANEVLMLKLPKSKPVFCGVCRSGCGIQRSVGDRYYPDRLMVVCARRHTCFGLSTCSLAASLLTTCTISHTHTHTHTHTAYAHATDTQEVRRRTHKLKISQPPVH